MNADRIRDPGTATRRTSSDCEELSKMGIELGWSVIITLSFYERSLVNGKAA